MSPSRNKSRSTTVIFLAALALTLAFAFNQRQETARLSAELTTTLGALKESQSTLAEQDGSVATLEKQVDELTEVLTLATEKLQQATAALSAPPPTRRAPPPMTAAQVSQLQSAVKDPAVTTKTDRKGTEVKTYFFPELIDPTGKHLASNMEFTKLYGTKVAFRSATGTPASYEAEELHPGILAHLGISLYEAKQEQDDWENKIKRRKELALQQQTARWKAMQLAAVEKAKRDKERRKELFDKNAKLAQIANERMKAEAAMKQADAAIMDAQRPPDYYVRPGFNYNGYVNNGGFVPTAPRSTLPRAQNANQIPAPQGTPQPKPFVAPRGQLPRKGLLKTP